MRKSWRSFVRRIAAVCFVGGASLWWSACQYAHAASDNASDPVYADGWQEGDNGGSGFTPWSFAGSYDNPGHIIDSSSPFNSIGTAWTLQLQPDILRAGRGFSPLQVGQTLTTIVDLPTEHRYFGGFGVNLITGGGNICYAGTPCVDGTMPVERFSVYNFNFNSGNFYPNEWGHIQTSSLAGTPYTENPALTSIDAPPDPSTDPPGNTLQNGGLGTDLGLRIEFTLGPTPEQYSVKLTPLSHPTMPYTETGSLKSTGAGAIDWIQFLYYDAPTDPSLATDFYIRSISIASAANADFNGDGHVDGADFLRWQRGLGTSSGATLVQGDSNGDGAVNATDLANWKAQFGSSTLAAASGVPEPSADELAGAALAGLGIAEIIRRERCRRA